MEGLYRIGKRLRINGYVKNVDELDFEVEIIIKKLIGLVRHPNMIVRSNNSFFLFLG